MCANGHLTDNKLAVGLLFPCLLTSDIFALPIENVLLVPDYTMEVSLILTLIVSFYSISDQQGLLGC